MISAAPSAAPNPSSVKPVEELRRRISSTTASTRTTTTERRSVSIGSEKPSDAGLASMGMENYPASPGGEERVQRPGDRSADAVIVQKHEPTLRGIVRVVATVVASAIALYLIYLLRTPIGWLFVATFVAVSVAAPVRRLERPHAARRRDRARLPDPRPDSDRDRARS